MVKVCLFCHADHRNEGIILEQKAVSPTFSNTVPADRCLAREQKFAIDGKYGASTARNMPETEYSSRGCRALLKVEVKRCDLPVLARGLSTPLRVMPSSYLMSVIIMCFCTVYRYFTYSMKKVMMKTLCLSRHPPHLLPSLIRSQAPLLVLVGPTLQIYPNVF